MFQYNWWEQTGRSKSLGVLVKLGGGTKKGSWTIGHCLCAALGKRIECVWVCEHVCVCITQNVHSQAQGVSQRTLSIFSESYCTQGRK